jgi:peptidoglycan/xylan/chitin deacetylase (PgdA/CDA1 family)
MKLPNTVINFHVIQNSGWMESILKMLSNNFNMVSAERLEDYYYKGLDLHNACHITIDDGDVSVYTHLFPLIVKYKIPVSIFVSPHAVITGKNFWFQEIIGYDLKQFLEFYNKVYNTHYAYNGKHQVNGLIKSLPLNEIDELISGYKNKYKIEDKPRRCLDVAQLRELNDSGLVSIGAHTMNHPILKNETQETVKKEISESIIQLEELLGCEVKYFAYPNGLPVIDFGEREIDILKDCKIKLAFSTQSKNFSTQDHPLSVPRRGITKGGPYFAFAKLSMGDYWEVLKKFLKGKQEPAYRN